MSSYALSIRSRQSSVTFPKWKIIDFWRSVFLGSFRKNRTVSLDFKVRGGGLSIKPRSDSITSLDCITGIKTGKWVKWNDQTSLFSSLMKQDHNPTFLLSRRLLPVPLCTKCGCVLVSVMIAVSYVKMSSCPSVPLSWSEIPLPGTQLSWVLRWKAAQVQGEAFGSCASLFSPSCTFSPFATALFIYFFNNTGIFHSFPFPLYILGPNHRAWWPWEWSSLGPQE